MIKLNLLKIFQPLECSELVRIGRENDGGYLVDKESIDQSDFLLSFGIDHDWSFEQDFLDINNCPLNSYDGSIGPRFFIKKLRLRLITIFSNPTKEYLKVSVYWFMLPLRFYRFFNILNFGKVKKHFEMFIGNEDENISFSEVMKNINRKYKNVFLKIDIEGSEYDFLNELLEYQDRISGLVIEFHNVNENLNKIIDFIGSTSLQIVHLHVNNYGGINKKNLPNVFELTFSKYSYSDVINYKLPHYLDMNNDKHGSKYTLEFI